MWNRPSGLHQRATQSWKTPPPSRLNMGRGTCGMSYGPQEERLFAVDVESVTRRRTTEKRCPPPAVTAERRGVPLLSPLGTSTSSGQCGLAPNRACCEEALSWCPLRPPLGGPWIPVLWAMLPAAKRTLVTSCVRSSAGVELKAVHLSFLGCRLPAGCPRTCTNRGRPMGTRFLCEKLDAPGLTLDREPLAIALRL